MKIILEYRKEGSHWVSLTAGFNIPTNDVVKDKMFGRVVCDYGNDGALNFDWLSSGFTLDRRDCPQTVSYATLTNLFKATTVAETEEGVPISNREWKVNQADVALLTVQEYEACLQGVENIVEYEAILAAATSMQAALYTVRFFIFK